jgi:predicted ATPase/class 3 adenylate cyclase/predicted negative regulator of RcsB-dependent stress response
VSFGSQSTTATFLFTDIEGSTRLWEREPERMQRALARHDAHVRTAIVSHRGSVVKMTGDGVCAAFDDALDALVAALRLQRVLADPDATEGIALRVRSGLHWGVVERRDHDYFGSAVNRAARIMGAAHGGQVLLSQAVVDRVRDRLPTEVSLRDLGTVRLRDLARPERVCQVLHPELRRDFPALRSLEATPNNLPQQVSSFVGREREQAELGTLLATARLVTLLGAGGLGKTRLSLQAAADVLDDFPDGAWFVELAPLSDARLVPQAVASVLGVREESGLPVREALVKHVGDRQLLLILDNCEHLLHACADLAKRLLQAGPRLKVLATSREPLRVTGESTYPLPPLAVPDPKHPLALDALAQCESVRLFSERAAAAQPGFRVSDRNAAAVTDICRRLDGIPLALELAAARVRVLPAEKIATRLTDRFRLLTGGDKTALPRQQTLRACIDWSYELLSEPERALLRRLAVFAGGWTLEAAEAVCEGDDVAEAGVLDGLTQLLEKSLIALEAERDRYALLETVRQYARDRLRESGDEARWQGRHLAYFLQVAEEAEPLLRSVEQQAWLDRLETEHDNLRSALTWSASADGNAEGGLRLAGALWWFWLARAHFFEGRGWLSAMLAGAADGHTVARGKALYGAGELAFQQGDYPAARASYTESLALRRQLGDRRGIAGALNNLGNVARDQGDPPSAKSLYEESLAIKRELGDRRGIAMSLNNLGNVAKDQGDYPAARALYEESLATVRELTDPRGIAMSLNNLGGVLLEQGHHSAARAHFEESLAIRRELGERQGVASSLNNLALVATAQGDYPAAIGMHKESLAIKSALGDRLGIAWSLEGLAGVAFALARLCRAARLWAGATRLRDEIGCPLPPDERTRNARQVAAARAASGDAAAFDMACREGRAMTLEQAIAYAFEQDDSGREFAEASSSQR